MSSDRGAATDLVLRMISTGVAKMERRKLVDGSILVEVVIGHSHYVVPRRPTDQSWRNIVLAAGGFGDLTRAVHAVELMDGSIDLDYARAMTEGT